MRPIGSKWLCTQDIGDIRKGEVFEVVEHSSPGVHKCKLLIGQSPRDGLLRLALDSVSWTEYHDKSTKFKEIYDILNSD